MTRDELLKKYAKIAQIKRETAEWLERNNFDFIAGAEFGDIVAQSNIREAPISQDPTEEEIREFEKIGIPSKGRDVIEVEEELMKYVFSKQALLQHPRFFSFVASAVSPYSIAGSILTDIYNGNAGSFNLNPCGGIIEEKLCEWMGSYAGYPKETCSGIFLSGGSISTLSAIIAARTNKLNEYDIPKGVAYLSDQTHSSVRKALRMLGFRNDQIVILKSDDNFKMDVTLLEEAIIKEASNKRCKHAINFFLNKEISDKTIKKTTPMAKHAKRNSVREKETKLEAKTANLP